VIVLALSSRDLHRLRFANADLDKLISRPASVAALFGAGVIHGIYASGGPMLVYAIGREGLTKRVFRSTLSMVWIILNTILIARFAMAGDYDREMSSDVLLLVPAVPFGILLGEWVHHKVDERSFKMAVLALLIAAAISLIVRYSAQLL
jgi:uncharacterized membrane protein YfcA